MREGTLDPANPYTKQQGIAELARRKRGTALCSLHHLLDLDWMKEAHRQTRKDGAAGIDGATAADYEVNLESNLLDLQERIKSGRYKAALDSRLPRQIRQRLSVLSETSKPSFSSSP